MDHQLQELPGILTMGDTKVGKSTILKNLAGGDDSFKIGGLAESQTKEFVGKTCKLTEVEYQAALIDSPGMEDNFNDLSNYRIYNRLFSFCLANNVDVGIILYCFREGMYNMNALNNFKHLLDLLGPKCNNRVFLTVTRTEAMDDEELQSLKAEIIRVLEKKNIKLKEDHILFPNRRNMGEFAHILVTHLKSLNSGRRIIEQINHETSLKRQAQMKFLLEAQYEEIRKSEKNVEGSKISEESKFLNRILMDERDWKLSELLSEIQSFVQKNKVGKDNFFVLISNYFKSDKCKEQLTLKNDITIALSDINKQNKQYYFSRSNFKKDLQKLLPRPLQRQILKTIDELMVKALNDKRLLKNSQASSLGCSSKGEDYTGALIAGSACGTAGFLGVSNTTAYASALLSAETNGCLTAWQGLGGMEGFLAASKSGGFLSAASTFLSEGSAGAYEAALTTSITALGSCIAIGSILAVTIYTQCWTYEGKVEQAADEVYKRIINESCPENSRSFREILIHCLNVYWLFLEQI